MEERLGEGFQRIGWELVGTLLADEVFIVPMAVAKALGSDQRRRRVVTYACSTWKHTRSTDVSSSSGRFKMKRLSIVSTAGGEEKRKQTHLDRSSRTSSRLRSE